MRYCAHRGFVGLAYLIVLGRWVYWFDGLLELRFVCFVCCGFSLLICVYCLLFVCWFGILLVVVFVGCAACCLCDVTVVC